jgi:hypothetical protein
VRSIVRASACQLQSHFGRPYLVVLVLHSIPCLGHVVSFDNACGWAQLQPSQSFRTSSVTFLIVALALTASPIFYLDIVGNQPGVGCLALILGIAQFSISISANLLFGTIPSRFGDQVVFKPVPAPAKTRTLTYGYVFLRVWARVAEKSLGVTRGFPYSNANFEARHSMLPTLRPCELITIPLPPILSMVDSTLTLDSSTLDVGTWRSLERSTLDADARHWDARNPAKKQLELDFGLLALDDRRHESSTFSARWSTFFSLYRVQRYAYPFFFTR